MKSITSCHNLTVQLSFYILKHILVYFRPFDKWNKSVESRDTESPKIAQVLEEDIMSKETAMGSQTLSWPSQRNESH